MDKKKILIISFSELKRDPRVRRQIRALSQDYEVYTAGYGSSEIDGVNTVDVSFKLNKVTLLLRLLLNVIGLYGLFNKLDPAVRSTFLQLKGRKFDLILANEVESLPVAFRLKNDRTRIIFDAHEYSPKEHEDDWVWNLLYKRYKIHLLKRYAGSCDRMFTVCDGIAELYHHEFGLSPAVMTNASEYEDLDPSSVNPDKIRIIYHGMAHPTRKTENMILLMDDVDERFELHLMLVFFKSEYRDKLFELAKSRPNVKIIDPVAMDQIVPVSSEYDIGMYLLEPTTFNNEYALPNKLFEFIQSRLAIVIGPSPEMAKIVRKHELGIVSADFQPQSIAAALNSLTVDSIRLMKQNSHETASKLNSEVNITLLKKTIEDILLTKDAPLSNN